MLQQKIEKLRNKLEMQISNNISYEDIYKTSIELDELIIQYYVSDKIKRGIIL